MGKAIEGGHTNPMCVKLQIKPPGKPRLKNQAQTNAMRRITQKSRQMPVIHETPGEISLSSVHYTESILAVSVWNVKCNCSKNRHWSPIFRWRIQKCVFPALTYGMLCGKIPPYADVVELVDSLDLGSNAQACRFESCHPHHLPMESWIHGSIGIFVLSDSNPYASVL